MTYKTTRNNDEQAEKILGEYFDEHLYNGGNGAFRDVRRITDREEQIKGVDVILSIPSLGLKDNKVDEKASSSYMLKHLDTFIMELQFRNKSGRLTTGWFLNDKLDTEYYLCVNPQVKHGFAKRVFGDEIPYDKQRDNENVKKIIDNLTPSDIDSGNIVYFLVSKKKLRNAIREAGITDEMLQRDIDELRPLEDDKSLPWYKVRKSYNKDMQLILVQNGGERPINLKINHSFYERIAEKFIQVKDGKVVKNFERGVPLI